MAEPARTGHDLAEARDATATRIHAMVAAEIGAEPDEFGRDENLIELGLASIALMRLQAAFAADGATVPLSALIAEPTVDAWTALVMESRPQRQTENDTTVAKQETEEAGFPLTDIQRAYWLGRETHFELGGTAAHGYIEARCDDLDIDRLEDALNATIAAHPMLRAVIGADGMQRVLDDVPRFRIDHADFSADDETGREKALQAIRDEMEQQVLPADCWPLYRVHASRVSERTHILHLSFDILVFDLKSLEIWLGEWWKRYSDPTATIPAPTARFRDHVTALEARARSEATEEARRYWRKRVTSMPLGPALPLIRPLEALTPPRFARLQTVLDRDDWQNLQNAIRERGLTASAVLLAAYARILSFWSENSHFSLTTTLFNRPMGPASDNVIGDFTSLTLVETNGVSAPAFLNFAQQVQAQLWRDLDHSAVSGVEVLGMVAGVHGLHNRAIMPYVFTSALGTGRSYLDAFSGFGEITRAAVQTPQTLLDHQALDHGGKLVLNWDHVEAAYAPGLIAELADMHLELLRKLANQPSAWDVATHATLPAVQANRRADANDTTWQAPTKAAALHEPFQQQVLERPDAIAVIADGKSWTYAGIDRASTRLAQWIAACQTDRSLPVSVLLPKGWQQVVAVLAILKAGFAYLPIDPALPDGRIKTLLEESGSELLLALPGNTAEPIFARKVIGVDDDIFDEITETDISTSLPQVGENDLAYIIFTSGSTGKPKGVAIRHGAALNTILDINARFGIGPADRCLMVSSLSFDLSVYDIFGLLAAGGTVVVPPVAIAPDPDIWLDLIENHGVTLWNSAPALMQLFHDRLTDRRRIAALSQLRLVMLSGDWLPLPLCRSLIALEYAPKLVSLGGATEAAIWSIAHEVDQIDTSWTSIPYGRALANQTIHVLDENFAERPDHAIGEIFIGGIGLADGYWRAPQKTAERFLTHPTTGERLYRTGDFGRWHPDGFVEFLGRRDGQVKVNGLRIELGEIETAIADDKTIRQVSVVASGMAGKGNRLVAFLACHENGGYDEAALRRVLGQKLAAAMIPTTFEVLDHLPLSINGKVDRKALERRAQELALPSDDKPAQPVSEVESRIRTIWQDLLDHPIESTVTSFFQAGGNSLLATRLAGRLSQAFDRPVSVIRVFEHPTIAGQAAFLAADGMSDAPPATSPAPTRIRRFRERARAYEGDGR
ncbi:amino acid adenylation domain-containing protein [Neorhizobium huautlense]|uniref:Amino acid adenylation domain-containing protein n=1 Tax=Neorhizobium huautlense TaxID=67774 RepID=A0ABT9PMJ5_9HYPH|nr:amino acid adenylation domain-containing protein [Neorhizobium huautlense]MDP9835682.1 amino acid adenylation domain-containing protein [Neorhizobium huautlense]